MAKEKLPKIDVTTLPNGYALTVDSKEYMAFTVESLVNEFLIHVGIGIANYLDDDTVKDMMTAVATWPNADDAVQAAATMAAESERLRKQIAHLKHNVTRLQERLDEAEDKNEELSKLLKLKPNTKPSKHTTKFEAMFKASPKPSSVITRGEVAQRKPETKPTQPKVKQEPAQTTTVIPTDALYEALTTPIAKTGLPSRVKSAMMLVGGSENKTVGDAIKHPQSEFKKVRGCGEYVMNTLQIYMVGHQLSFGMDVDAILATYKHPDLK